MFTLRVELDQHFSVELLLAFAMVQIVVHSSMFSTPGSCLLISVPLVIVTYNNGSILCQTIPGMVPPSTENHRIRSSIFL